MSRWTNQGQPAAGVFGQTLGFPFQNILCLGVQNRIQWSCSWFCPVVLVNDFKVSIQDFVPDPFKDFRVVVLCEIKLSAEGCHLFKHGVFLRIKNERKLICEFHILIIHENAHHWENSGQSADWHSGSAGFFILWENGLEMKGFHPQRVHMWQL